MRVSRSLPLVLLAVTTLLPSAQATTLEKLSLDDMILKSTEIVRGRVLSVSGVKVRSLIYTQVLVQVNERFKGSSPDVVEVYIPGGTYGRERLTFSGAPELRPGYEYMLFLWAGKSAMRQVIGFSQGVFDLKVDGKTEGTLIRGAISETMLDPRTGQEASDTPVSMRLGQMRDRIRAVLDGRSAAQ